MNMLALRYGDDIIVIDAGLMFPEQELLGVDIVIPDITYLKQNKRMVRAIVLTHGHEDHIGAIPYILRDLNVPIYGTQFTLALVRKKLEEHGAAGLRRSCTKWRPATVDHDRAVSDRISARDAQHHRLRGAGDSHAGGRHHPHRRFQDRSRRRWTEKPFDLHAFARYGQEGVLALFSDSTNVERPGIHAFGTRGGGAAGRIVPRGAASAWWFPASQARSIASSK